MNLNQSAISLVSDSCCSHSQTAIWKQFTEPDESGIIISGMGRSGGYGRICFNGVDGA